MNQALPSRRLQVVQGLAVLGILLILLGLFFSPALMSIGMMVLAGMALLHPDLGPNLRAFLRQPAYLALTGVFVLYLLSGLHSADLPEWAGSVRMKLPFLVLPFAFFSIPRFGPRLYHGILAGFFWLVVVLSLYSLALFLMDMEQMTYLYRESKVMPTPVMHVRFSLMVAFAIAIGWDFFQDRLVRLHPLERYAFPVATLFLVFYLHLLAVRTGLLALYGIALYLFVREVLLRSRYGLGLLVALLFGLSLWVSYQAIPTLRNKIGYTLYSIELLRQGEAAPNLSDSQRYWSIRAGWAVAREHPWFGVGVGDLKTEADQYFQQYVPGLAGSGLWPHNQVLLILAATGLFGALYFCLAMAMPLWADRAYRDPLFVAFHILIFLSFLFDHTLETQLGMAFYTLFVLMGMTWNQRRVAAPAEPGPTP